jgi:hypothetical protein
MQGTLEEWGTFPLLFGFSGNYSLCRPGPIVVAEIILLKLCYFTVGIADGAIHEFKNNHDYKTDWSFMR